MIKNKKNYFVDKTCKEYPAIKVTSVDFYYGF